MYNFCIMHETIYTTQSEMDALYDYGFDVVSYYQTKTKNPKRMVICNKECAKFYHKFKCSNYKNIEDFITNL